MSKQKTNRLYVIRDIISKKDIANQDELLKELSLMGYKLTQATLSRDIKELQIAKVPDGEGAYRYRLAPHSVSKQANSDADVSADTVRGSAISLAFSGYLAVLKTRPGYASVMADIVDKGQSPHIIGTLAGDDTVLLILNESSTRRDVVSDLALWMPDIEKKVI